ncbi:hypothetical protein FRB95_000691, partial [Tulasnella sp. JGI-2019a]
QIQNGMIVLSGPFTPGLPEDGGCTIPRDNRGLRILEMRQPHTSPQLLDPFPGHTHPVELNLSKR